MGRGAFERNAMIESRATTERDATFDGRDYREARDFRWLR
jgi:hypothetical protein